MSKSQTASFCKTCQIPLASYLPFQVDDEWRKPCNSCTLNMTLQESVDPYHESEWICECGSAEYSQKSLFDAQQSLYANQLGVKVEYESKTVRAPQAVRFNRREICASCEHGMNNKTCSHCGCRIKHRTYYLDLACPLNHW